VANFNNLKINSAGSYSITASDSTHATVASATTNPFTVNPGTLTKLVFTSTVSGSHIVTSSANVGPFQVQAQDNFGNPITNTSGAATVTLSSSSSGTYFFTTASGGSSASAVTIANNASSSPAFYYADNKAGSPTITASATVNGTLVSGTTNGFTMAAGTASKVAFVQQPSTTTAGNAINPAPTVQVEDTFGNPVADSGATVTISPNGFAFTGGSATSALTNAGGLATFNNLVTNAAGSNYSLTAASSGLGTVNSIAFTVNPAAENKLVITTQPAASIAAGATITVGVTVEDQFGNPITTGNTGSTDSLHVALSSGSFASGTTTLTAGNGVANFNNLKITAPGTYMITATDATTGTVTQVTTISFTVNPAAENKLAITTQPAASITAGGTVSVGVTVEDQFGNPITTGNTGSTDSLHVALSSGSFASGTTTLTATNGFASFSGLQITAAGTYTITATDATTGTVTQAMTNSFTVNPAAENKLVITAQPASFTAGGSAALGVTVEDQFGNPITSGSGSTDSLHVALSSGSFASGTTTVGATGGSASFSGLQITAAGTYMITATDATTGTVTQATTTSFTVSAAAANKLVFNTQPSNSTGGIAFPTQPQVTVEDQYSNVVTTDSSTVTLKIATSTPTSGGPGTLSGCTQSETLGVVTFSSCSINTAGTGYKLTATDGALTSATSNAFNITVGPIAQFGVSAPASATAGIAFNVTLTAQDAGGNTVTSYPSGSHAFAFSGPVTSPGAPGTATPPSYPASVTFGAGTGTGIASVILYDAQTVQLTATSAGISGISSNITVSAAGASKIGVISGAGQTATVSKAFTNPLVAVVTDNYGNGVQGVSVTFAGPSTAASVTFGSSGCTSNPHTYSCVATTGANGQATSSTMTANATTGTYNVVGSATGVTGTVNFSETNKINLAATSVASGTSTGNVTTSSFNMVSGTTYIVTAFEASNRTPGTPTLTITGNPTATPIATNNFGGRNGNCADDNHCDQWVWWFNASNSAAGTTISVSFSGTPVGNIVDVLALSGNSTTTPVVQSNTNSGCSGGGCANNTTTVTANLTSAPAAGDITLQILGSDDSIGNSANAWSPATTNLYFNGSASNSAALQVDVASPGAQNESTSANGFGGSQDWGTIAIEIGHA
jgi:hypothetical protein